MAATKISDIIIPDVWIPYVIQRTMEKSALVQSGIVVPNPVFDELARKGGQLINMPFFTDLTGNDEVLSDALALSPGAIGTAQDVAVLHMRGRAWGVNDLAKALSGADPMSAIGDLVAGYWNRREQALLFSTLAGIFATTLSTSHVKDVSTVNLEDITEANLIGGSIVIDACTLLGDEASGLTAIAMHSVPFSRLQKLSLIEYVNLDSAGNRVEAASADTISVPTFLGKRVIVDDTCPVAESTPDVDHTKCNLYTSYLFGPGAIARGEGNAPVPVETDRDSLAGEDYLIHRRHFILHPRGVKYNKAAQVGAAPTNAECENAANWTRVWESKAVRMVKLVTNG